MVLAFTMSVCRTGWCLCGTRLLAVSDACTIRLNGIVPLAALLSAAEALELGFESTDCDWSTVTKLAGEPLGPPALVKSYVECSFACARHSNCTGFQYTATAEDKWWGVPV